MTVAAATNGHGARGAGSLALDEAVARLAAGDVRTLSRAMSLVENHDPLGAALLERSFGHGVEPWVIGLTGVGGRGQELLAAPARAPDDRAGRARTDPRDRSV